MDLAILAGVIRVVGLSFRWQLVRCVGPAEDNAELWLNYEMAPAGDVIETFLDKKTLAPKFPSFFV